MKLTITRTDGITDVLILKHKLEDKYSYVNLTKGHICPCKFDSIEEALEDLKNYPKVLGYIGMTKKIDKENSILEVKKYLNSLHYVSFSCSDISINAYIEEYKNLCISLNYDYSLVPSLFFNNLESLKSSVVSNFLDILKSIEFKPEDEMFASLSAYLDTVKDKTDISDSCISFLETTLYNYPELLDQVNKSFKGKTFKAKYLEDYLNSVLSLE